MKVFKTLSTVAFSLLILVASSAKSETTGSSQECPLAQKLQMPVYQWLSNNSSPRALVIAIHGLALHGRSYDALAKYLAKANFLVFSTDLRGYGCFNKINRHKFCNNSDCKQKINYEKSFDDLTRLASSLRKEHPDLPIFCIGESLGADLVIRLASQRAHLVDGLILSAPAIKRQSIFADPYTFANISMLVANPLVQFDLTPFVKRYASDDPRIVEEILNDPLLRRRISIGELFKASQTVRKTIRYVRGIPPTTPVLIIQGSADRCVKANAVVLLLSRLRSLDQTVRWFHERGHILLETTYIKRDTQDTVLGWLLEHVNRSSCQTPQHKNTLTKLANQGT